MVTVDQALGNEPMPEVETPPEVAAEPEQVTDAATEVVEDVAAGEKPTETEVKAEAPTDSSPEPDKTVPITAFHGERDKKREYRDDNHVLREDNEALRRQLAGFQQAAEKPIDFFEDPDGALKAQEMSFNTRMAEEARGIVAVQHGADVVDAAWEWAQNAASESPLIARQFSNLSFAETYVKAIELHQKEQARAEMTDPEKTREELKAEVKAELLAEQEEEKKKKVADSVPDSLVGDGSKGNLKGSTYTGPPSIESVIGKGA